ncbi:8780_t:CDS:2 [Cetraspora pellucida]|uniref:8780_t:CDS:1 n=1 Tax=Cetraspora pellucida TaxID=1433469 RepID=A0A9N9JLN7_9GLOM|nr:8780_t:CDS:2 [Cetraspora pellucida]
MNSLKRKVKHPYFRAFLAGEGKKFEKPLLGQTNYLQPNCPFPMNPQYKPQPPLSDFAKEEIWKRFIETGQSVRELGTFYGVSIKRVEAILRLKKLEKDMIQQGVPIQKNFSINMEKMMGARSHRQEPLTEMLPKVGKPKFHLVDEGKKFTPEPLASLQEQELRKEVIKPFTLEEKTQQQLQTTTVIRKDSEITNRRFKFRFKNTGEDNDITIRDQDGTLLKVNKLSS